MEALRLFEEIAPPIVITDIKMPDMDGIELLRRIKKLNPDTEVIMFTGHGDMGLAIKSLKNDATDFVTKPINDEILDLALIRARERINMRRQLREYTENLEKLVAEKAQKLIEAERMAAVGQTVAELSHAIKSIANGLKGSIFELDNKQYLHEGWQMVEGNVEKIKNLSLDLLNYGKYSDVTFTEGDANAPAAEVIELLTSRAQALGITLRADLSDQLPPVRFDREGIHRCLLNLVTNAIDACREENARGKVVTVKTQKPEAWAVEYQVIDSGSGMTKDVQDKIFQSFFSTKGIRGTGIGLMMTKRIVDQHQGIIEVTSEKAAGSIISIKLPFQE
jgi:signal transduction histidine kinase